MVPGKGNKWRLASLHVHHNAEHKGATRNAPWHGLSLEARGTETGRQATREPKGWATPRREKEEEWKSKKPDGKESLTSSTRLRWGGEDPPATETYTREPRPPVIQQQGTTMWSKVRPWTGLQTPMETAPLSPLDAPPLPQRAARVLAGRAGGFWHDAMV